MTTRENQDKTTRQQRSYSGSSRGANENLSEAAQKMRSGNPQERSKGAQELGKAGGSQSHKNDPGRRQE